MISVHKITTRDNYGSTLAKLGQKYKNLIVLDADLVATIVNSVFHKALSEGFINCDVAENNIIVIMSKFERAHRRVIAFIKG